MKIAPVVGYRDRPGQIRRAVAPARFSGFLQMAR